VDEPPGECGLVPCAAPACGPVLAQWAGLEWSWDWRQAAGGLLPFVRVAGVHANSVTESLQTVTTGDKYDAHR
jgi:hypothetical protein